MMTSHTPSHAMIEPSSWAQVYIGLGSNLGDSQQLLEQACAQISLWPSVKDLRVSKWYRSRPQGPQDQPDFVNGACGFLTCLAPEALLDQLQALESAMGRVKQRHWGERLIDLDIICYAERLLKTERLSLPHPMAAQRDFVLVPLLDLAPGLVLPGYGSIESCLASLPDNFLYASDVSNHKVMT